MALLSISIPTISRPELLERHLRHLAGFKSIELEVAISNNDATNRTDSVIHGFASAFASLRVVKQGRPLPYWLNLDAAMRLATGKYMIHLADDDLAREAELRDVVSLLEANPGIVAAYGGHELKDHGSGASLGFRRFAEQVETYAWTNREALMAKHWILEHPVCRTDVFQRFTAVTPPTTIFHWSGIANFLRVGVVAVVPGCLYDHFLHRDRFTHEKSADPEWILEWSSEIEQAAGRLLADSPMRASILAAQQSKVYQFLAGVNATEGRPSFARFFIAKGLAHEPATFLPMARQWDERLLLPAMVEVLATRVSTAGPVSQVAVEQSELSGWLCHAIRSALPSAGVEAQVRVETADTMTRCGPTDPVFSIFRSAPPGNIDLLRGRYSVVADLIVTLRLSEGDLNLTIPPIQAA